MDSAQELNSPRAKAGALGYNRPLAEQPDKTGPTYKAIRKLLPVLQGGNQTAIVFALCQLQEIDLAVPPNPQQNPKPSADPCFVRSGSASDCVEVVLVTFLRMSA